MKVEQAGRLICRRTVTYNTSVKTPEAEKSLRWLASRLPRGPNEEKARFFRE